MTRFRCTIAYTLNALDKKKRLGILSRLKSIDRVIDANMDL